MHYHASPGLPWTRSRCVSVIELSGAGEVCSPPLITHNQAFAEVWVCLFAALKRKKTKKKHVEEVIVKCISLIFCFSVLLSFLPSLSLFLPLSL